MIFCITLNPCLDKTLTVPPWQPGENIRGRAVREVVGGKGNNVARALSRLGREPRPVTFLGGPTGLYCESLLREQDRLEPLVVRTQSPTREILTVRTEATPLQTAFFDPDPSVTPAEAEALLIRGRACPQIRDGPRPDAVRIEPDTGDARPVQRPDRRRSRAPRSGFSGHLWTGSRRDLGFLADGPPAQPAGSRHPAPQVEHHRRRRGRLARETGIVAE